MNQESKTEKIFYKQWWFWIIMLIALIVIGITIIMVVALNIATEGINEVALEVQRIDNQATVYTSAGGNTIVIELSNDSKEIREQVEKKIQNYATSGGILSNYSNLVIYIPSKVNDNSILVKNVYVLPTLEQDASKEKIYIDGEDILLTTK